MVTSHDPDLIQKFKKHFWALNLRHVEVNPQTGRVDVRANKVSLNTLREIPVPMGKIDGDFTCESCELTHLTNAPTEVTGSFWCHKNNIESLVGGPHSVGGNYFCGWNRLKDLQGAPENFTGLFVAVLQQSPGLQSLEGIPPNARHVSFSYHAHLPLLKLVDFTGALDVTNPRDLDRMYGLMDILQRYTGKGKHEMLKLALELKEKGYAGAAKW